MSRRSVFELCGYLMALVGMVTLAGCVVPVQEQRPPKREVIVRERPAPPPEVIEITRPEPVPQREIIYVDRSHPHASHVYYYYPREKVYYDPAARLYYWPKKHGWGEGDRLPKKIKIRSEDQIIFESDAARPYDVHERVVERFGRPAPSSERFVVYVDENRPRPTHICYYYPGEDVYFDESARQYFWLQRGAWFSGPTLPPRIVLNAKNRIVFETDALRPVTVHEKVVRAYRARPYQTR